MSKLKVTTAAIVFILLLIIFFTPLLVNFNSVIPHFESTDEPFGALWDFWRLEYSLNNKTSLLNSNLISYPFGVNFSENISYVWMGINAILSYFASPVAAYNTQIIVNFFLVALFAYFLVFHLTGSQESAIFSGIIFSFCPYHFVRAWQHLSATYIQWIPLCLLSIILLRKRLSLRFSLLFLLSVTLMVPFDAYIIFMTFIALGTYLVYVLLYGWKEKIKIGNSLVKIKFVDVIKISALSLATFVIVSLQNFRFIWNIFSPDKMPASGYNPFHRPFDDLFVQSARPLSYFLPSTTHPIFGKFTRCFVGSNLWGVSYTEHQLYLGWVPLLLAFLAFRRWKRMRPQVACGSSELKRDNFYIGFFLILMIVAWLFSQPPWWQIGSFRIFMPAFFIYKIFPMIRAYCRFGIVVMLAVAVLAGYGLRYILEKFKTIKSRVLITSVVCFLVLFEFWNCPSDKIIDVSKSPAVYYWLKKEAGEFAIAEYPLDIDLTNDLYRFYQTFHQHPIINGTIPGTYPNKVARSMVKLSDRRTASVLKWLGVKYVLVHRQYYLDTEILDQVEELKRIPKNPGLKFIKSFPAESCPSGLKCIKKSGPIDVYEVIAKPQPPKLK